MTYLDTLGLAVNVTSLTLVETSEGGGLGGIHGIGLGSDLSRSGRLGADESGKGAGDEDGETHVDGLLVGITELVFW